MRNKLLFFITIFLVATAVSFTFDQIQNEPIKAPLNPAFIRYIDSVQMGLHVNGPPIGDYAGERPSPVDMSHVVSSQGSGQTLPGFYDLRTQNRLTEVKDQGDCASCWAFATLASLESFLMPPAYNFSEQDLIEDHGFDYAECGGGNVFMSTAYLARWEGPLDEADFPYPYAVQIQSIYDAQKHVQEVTWIPQRTGYTGNDLVKEFVMNKGAVYMSLRWDPDAYNEFNHSYYYSGAGDRNHGVALVGWDDSFDRNLFNIPAPGDGAFIVQESWGTDFGEAGYYYVSYYDTSVVPRAAFHNGDPTDYYEEIHQYDTLGWTSNIGYDSTIAEAANVFWIYGGDLLRAVSFYTNDLDTDVKIWIYKDLEENDAPDAGTQVHYQEASFHLPGYHTVELDTLIGLQMGYFSVIIRFENSSYEFPLAVEQDISGYSSSSWAWEYESYVRPDSNSEWFDLGLNWTANACIKAFTETCRVPQSPWDEFPGNGAQDVPLDTILSWERVAGAENYDVYFGATYPPPLAVTTAENSYDPGTLFPGTAYFWSITARNICGEDDGYIWKFITTGTIVQHTLTINAGTGGTTDPDPGVYTKNSGDEIYIYADPNEGYDFDHWVGDADPEEATYSWINIIMDSDKGVTAHFVGEDPRISVSEYRLNFGGTTAGVKTSDQTFLITNSGGGTLDWELYYTASWISCQPQYGTGDTLVTVSVDPAAVGPGGYMSEIEVLAKHVGVYSRDVDIYFDVYSTQEEKPPFGYFDTPLAGTTVSGNVPVSGWALDDIEVEKVMIKRNSHPDDPIVSIGPDGLVLIGKAVFVKGAREDVRWDYQNYPLNDRAGWGCMVLTNYFPEQGNGEFILSAFAHDKSGNVTKLGSKSITCDNANRVKPFGTIDTPARGDVISGMDYINFGWALTPLPKTIPKDGSTIWVYIDGHPEGNPVYNQYRVDIATLFPGYNNSDGAVGFFRFDTTEYSNGVHTMSWSVTDNQGSVDGIGSRYFEIQNLGASSTSLKAQAKIPKRIDETGRLEIQAKLVERGFTGPNHLMRGAGETRDFRISRTREGLVDRVAGPLRINIQELERIVIKLEGMGGKRFAGWGRDVSDALPIGSTLDVERGYFYWSPGPGFLGEHILHFVVTNGNSRSRPVKIIIQIDPKK